MVGGLEFSGTREAVPNSTRSCQAFAATIGTMTRQETLSILKAHLPEFRERYGVERLALFGSLARDEAREDSDVDIIVDFAEPATLFELVGLKQDLEALLGRKVDVGTLGALKEPLEPEVKQDMIYVA